jgi:hypothetical protein
VRYWQAGAYQALHRRGVLGDAADVSISADALVMAHSGLGAACIGAAADHSALINVLHGGLQFFNYGLEAHGAWCGNHAGHSCKFRLERRSLPASAWACLNCCSTLTVQPMGDLFWSTLPAYPVLHTHW